MMRNFFSKNEKKKATSGSSSSTFDSKETKVNNGNGTQISTTTRTMETHRSNSSSYASQTETTIFSRTSMFASEGSLRQPLSPKEKTNSSKYQLASIPSYRSNSDQLGLKIPSTHPATHRTAFGQTTFGTYPSRGKPTQSDATNIQNLNLYRAPAPSILGNNRSTGPVIPTYPNNCLKRGKALIINNIKFADKGNDERFGAEKDAKDLSTLFKNEIKFDVDSATNISSKRMIEKVKKFSQSSFKSYDMAVVIMMSHGNNLSQSGNPVTGGYTEVFGTDNSGVPIDEFIASFTSDKCDASLKGKPKIFIFQCCRGGGDERAVDSAPTRPVVKQHSDVLIAFSTLPGFVSNRDPTKGTWYIQSICNVFRRHYKDHHVEDMLKIVDDELSKKHPVYAQTSTYESRGFKRCYLYPQPL